jgi:hypothetical protein
VLPADTWLSYPPSSTMQLIQYDLVGADDTPSTPFYVISHYIFGVYHPGYAGVEWVAHEDKQWLVISRGINTYWGDQFGFCANDNAIQCKHWRIDLHKRYEAASMPAAVLTLAEFPPAVLASMTVLFVGDRNANAPTYMHGLFRKEKPFFFFTQPGISSGESAYGFAGFEEPEGRQRFTGYPQFSGLASTAVDYFPVCLNANVSVASESEDFMTAAGHVRIRSDVSTEDIGEEYLTEDRVQLYLAQDVQAAEGRWYPFGFGPGIAGAVTGFNDADHGQCTTFIGSALVYGPNASSGSCPYAVTGCFQSLWSPTGYGGAVFSGQPAASIALGFNVGFPYLTAWKPHFGKPEQQAASLFLSPLDMLAPTNSSRYYMSAFTNTRNHRAMLGSFVVAPHSSTVEPRNEIYLMWLE